MEQFGSYFSMKGHNVPKKDVYFLAQSAFHNAMEFITDEGINLLACKFELITTEHEQPDYINGKWDAFTSVAWKITVNQESQ